MTKELGKKPAVSSSLVELDTLQDRIRARAYELYEERGKKDSHEMDDWLRAEAELTLSEYHSTVA